MRSFGHSPVMAVRPEGANHQWRMIPPRELSIDLVVPIGNSILLATDIESGDAPVLCERFVA
jgi:hypothetical protein